MCPIMAAMHMTSAPGRQAHYGSQSERAAAEVTQEGVLASASQADNVHSRCIVTCDLRPLLGQECLKHPTRCYVKD